MAATVTTPTVVNVNTLFVPTTTTITSVATHVITPQTVTGVTRFIPTPAYKRWDGTSWVLTYAPK